MARKHLANTTENNTYRYDFFAARLHEHYELGSELPADVFNHPILTETQRLSDIVDSIEVPYDYANQVWLELADQPRL